MRRGFDPLTGTGAMTWRPRTDADQAWARAAVRRGDLQRILPNLYVAPGQVTLELKAAATMHAHPDAVITGASAARLDWWPELAAATLSAARATKARPTRGFTWEQRTIPENLIRTAGGLRLTTPALTVLDLIPGLGGHVIDEALRRKACTLTDLWGALDLTPHRPGNAERRLLLHDSRDEPWSEAERNLHRHYRDCDLPFAYATNFWVTLTDGRRTPLDFAIPELKLAFEADGFTWHGGRGAFEYDRDRDSDLASKDWWVIRFSASFLEHEATEVRRRLTAIVGNRARSLGLSGP